MHYTKTIMASALVAGASAQFGVSDVQTVHAVVRDVLTYYKPRGVSRVESVFRRQSDECVAQLEEVAEVFESDPPPTPDYEFLADLQSYAEENSVPTPTGCDAAEITGTLGEQLTSYTDDLMSWWSAHTGDLREIYSACSDAPGFEDQLLVAAAGCTSLLEDVTGTSDGAQETGGADEDDEGAASSIRGGAAMAAMAVAGVVAAVL